MEGVRRWTVPAGVAAVVAAALVVLTVAVVMSLTANAVYPFRQGVFTYRIEYEQTNEVLVEGTGLVKAGNPISEEAEGTLTYIVEEGPEPGTMTIRVQATVSDTHIQCGQRDCTYEQMLYEDISEIRFIVHEDPSHVEFVGSDSGKPLPKLVRPDVLPGANPYGGMPFGFGPPFPNDALDVGDTWYTSGPLLGENEDGYQFTAEHHVVREEEVDGRRTVLIESLYQIPAVELDSLRREVEAVPPISDTHGPHHIEVAVWFDPSDRIVVRALLESNTTSLTKFENGQTRWSSGATHIGVELNRSG